MVEDSNEFCHEVESPSGITLTTRDAPYQGVFQAHESRSCEPIDHEGLFDKPQGERITSLDSPFGNTI